MHNEALWLASFLFVALVFVVNALASEFIIQEAFNPNAVKVYRHLVPGDADSGFGDPRPFDEPMLLTIELGPNFAVLVTNLQLVNGLWFEQILTERCQTLSAPQSTLFVVENLLAIKAAILFFLLLIHYDQPNARTLDQ